MNRCLPKLFCFLILLILSGCAASTVNKAVNQGATVLDAQEIFTLVSENTLHLVASDFDSYVFFSEDGSLSGKSIFDNNLDYGRWDIKSDSKICMKYSVWYFGDVTCYTVYKDAEKDQYLFFINNGSLAYTVTASSGNPQRIKIKDKTNKKSVFVRANLSKEQISNSSSSEFVAETVAVAPTVTHSAPKPSQEEIQHTIKSMAQNCPGCNFEDADLRNANLIGANLKKANLKGADLSRANLRRANLEGANLAGAVLLSTNLPGANLKDADLSGADLTGSNLIQTDFTGADLDGTILDNTLQEGTKGLK